MENKNWVNDFINLGEVKVGETVEVKFIATKELKIKGAIASCGCSTPKYDKKGAKELIVVYKVGSIPRHLESAGFYTTTKTITVSFEDGSEDILKFHAKVVK